jgi:hypothetical protein
MTHGIVNVKDIENLGFELIMGSVISFSWKDWEKPRWTSKRITGSGDFLEPINSWIWYSSSIPSRISVIFRSFDSHKKTENNTIACVTSYSMLFRFTSVKLRAMKNFLNGRSRGSLKTTCWGGRFVSVSITLPAVSIAIPRVALSPEILTAV